MAALIDFAYCIQEGNKTV